MARRGLLTGRLSPSCVRGRNRGCRASPSCGCRASRSFCRRHAIRRAQQMFVARQLTPASCAGDGRRVTRSGYRSDARRRRRGAETLPESRRPPPEVRSSGVLEFQCITGSGFHGGSEVRGPFADVLVATRGGVREIPKQMCPRDRHGVTCRLTSFGAGIFFGAGARKGRSVWRRLDGVGV